MATRVSRAPRSAGVLRPLLLGSAVIAVITAAGVIALLYRPGGQTSSPAPLAAGEQFLYAEFGSSVDTIWKASANDPAQRRAVLRVKHASEYGIVSAAISADGRSLAYNVLPPETRSPTPDSPADLWVAGLGGDGRAIRVAGAVDLLVRPLWSPAADGLVVRRSGPAGYTLILARIDGHETTLTVSADAALFPVAYGPGGVLYYVKLSQRGSVLYALDPGTAAERFVARLSDDLTRDWTLSPAGDKLAYLALNVTRENVASRALVLDLAAARVTPLAVDGDAFAPAWRGSSEDLTVGRVAPGRGAAALRIGDAQPPLPAPERGFDVPAAWSPSGARLAVRSFDGASAAAPGNSTVTLVAPGGARTKVASGEVTFIGWISP